MTFIGIDPGRKGGIALISEQGLRVWEMPPEQHRGINLAELNEIITHHLTPWDGEPIGHVAIEWNTCRPEEVPDFAMRFGIQSGELRAMFFARGLDVDLVPPNTWMQKLGLPGKDGDFECRQRAELVSREFPGSNELWTGPRGGVHDGILESICIALYERVYWSTPLGRKTGPRKPTFRGIEPE